MNFYVKINLLINKNELGFNFMLKKFLLILFINLIICFSCLAKDLTLVHLTDIQVDSVRVDNKVRMR